MLNSVAQQLSFQTFKNDPTGLRLYTLDNGLKVYLSKQTDEPKIHTYIAVKAGSNYDPIDNTGLAHYLEHMLFKGTSHLGTSDWEKEKVLLDSISNLYEDHKKEPSLEKKEAIYKKIDQLSNKASKLSIANEYDKVISALGAQGTNAFTSSEVTAYVNTIPSNELSKWLSIEKERFSELVLRLFHTELETVYEEFNKNQDNDGRKMYQSLISGLFPNHPYGTQTTIGTADHLKNPSMKAIHAYFDKYYVPNNMAMILVGDIDFDKTINEIQNTFGKFEAKPVEHPVLAVESPIENAIEKNVYGPSGEFLYLGYRTPAATDISRVKRSLIQKILNNSVAGLLDLNLNAKQKVLGASVFKQEFKEYGFFGFYARPTSGQSLDEVKKLLLDQVSLLKSGAFDDWLVEAAVNDVKKEWRNYLYSADGRAYTYLYNFYTASNWSDQLNDFKELEGITKQEIVDYANEFFKDNYVVVKKNIGEDPAQVKVEKPEITPVALNRDKSSEFLNAISDIKSEKITPKFVDLSTEIEKSSLKNGVSYAFIKHPIDDIAELTLTFPVGNVHFKDLGLAFSYLKYVGTSSKSNAELKKAFYRLGVDFNFSSSEEETKLSVKGIEKNIGEGLQLLMEYLKEAKADDIAYQQLVNRILQSRENNKKDKASILWKGLLNYGVYGMHNPIRIGNTTEELKAKSPEELLKLTKSVLKYKPEVFYYGQKAAKGKKAIQCLDKEMYYNDLPEPSVSFKNQESLGKIFFVDYDMVQTEILFLSKSVAYDPLLIAPAKLLSTYFGSGLSSIIFQEMRESKSLAYSAMSKYSLAREKDKPNYNYAYIGTQADKMFDAIEGLEVLLEDLPENQAQFENAKDSMLKSMAAKRVIGDKIYRKYRALKKLGLTEDQGQQVYNKIEAMTFEDLKSFFNTYIKGRKKDLLIVGNKKDLDIERLKTLGDYEELSVDYLFNY